MQAKNLVEGFRAQGFEIYLGKTGIKISGQYTQKQKDLIKENKGAIKHFLQQEQLESDQEQITYLVENCSKSRELAELIFWCWENCDLWPMDPFDLQLENAEIIRVDNPKDFYHQIGLAIGDGGSLSQDQLLLILKALKSLI